MAGKQAGGGYEAELNRIRAVEDWRIPKAPALQNALRSLDSALAAVLASSAWEGSAAESAKTSLNTLRAQFRNVEAHVSHITRVIDTANSIRRETAAAELPSAQVDSFWANAARVGSVVVHPVLGPLAADTALDAIGNFLGNKREEEARKIVERVEASLQEPAKELLESSERVASFNMDVTVPGGTDDQPGGSDPGVTAPRISYPSGIGGPSGSAPGVGGVTPPGGGVGEYHPPVPTNPAVPSVPAGPGDGGWVPEGPGDRPGDVGIDDPSIDSPGGGLLPGGPGGGLPGGSGGPGGSGSGSLPGGALPGGVFPGGSGGLGGIVGGGAGAAAIAASSKIAGFGSMGGLGGAGLGPGAGAGLKAGGGLLGNSAVGGGVGGVGGAGGMAGAGGVGGAGASGTGSSGAAGAGGRPGMGMMGGAGGADEEEKAKRSGLGGPIAPKLEDDEEVGPRAKGARAGSRDEPAN
ncbi:hypothetical protein [Microbacterium paraoxydans]|jgi:hypothetical protein|uniref:hypothetical protein n=1 Tax=Microbacterium paraoxydans TaxID=199592 RepID=UPI00119FF552|nr:hypothetical protein [Microbacterium paraoxydans]